jgi:hypothetical protein
LAIVGQLLRPIPLRLTPTTLPRQKDKAVGRLVVAIVDVEAAEAVEAAVVASSRVRAPSKGRLVSRVSQASRRANSRRRAELLALSKQSLAAMAPTLTMRRSKSARVVSEKDDQSAAT